MYGRWRQKHEGLMNDSVAECPHFFNATHLSVRSHTLPKHGQSAVHIGSTSGRQAG